MPVPVWTVINDHRLTSTIALRKGQLCQVFRQVIQLTKILPGGHDGTVNGHGRPLMTGNNGDCTVLRLS